MPMHDNGADAGSSTSAYTTIARIAEVLGCPVEALTSGACDPLDVTGASELLSLWVEIDDPASRKRLLELARKLANAS